MAFSQAPWWQWVVQFSKSAASASAARPAAERIGNDLKDVPLGYLQRFFQTGWEELKQISMGQGAVRRQPPAVVPRPPPVIGDPRWPNRVWPARRGQTTYAKRLLYRPPPVIKALRAEAPKPALQPTWRHTESSHRARHYVTTREAQALRNESLLKRSTSTPLLKHRYAQVGGNVPLVNGVPRIAFGGATSTHIVCNRLSNLTIGRLGREHLL